MLKAHQDSGHTSNKRNSISLLENLHWLPLGELVKVSPRQTQAECIGFLVVSLAESAWSLPASPYGRTDGRADGRAYADVIANFFRIDWFPFSINSNGGLAIKPLWQKFCTLIFTT